MLLVARRSAVDAAADAQRQLFSLVIAAPEPIRKRLRDHHGPALVKIAARLRVHPSWDRETTTTVTTLRALARRSQSHGDRQLNRALHTVALTRIRRDQRTRAYLERRTAEGKTPREIRRCLKNYIARDLYRLLESGPTTS